MNVLEEFKCFLGKLDRCWKKNSLCNYVTGFTSRRTTNDNRYSSVRWIIISFNKPIQWSKINRQKVFASSYSSSFCYCYFKNFLCIYLFVCLPLILLVWRFFYSLSYCFLASIDLPKAEYFVPVTIRGEVKKQKKMYCEFSSLISVSDSFRC